MPPSKPRLTIPRPSNLTVLVGFNGLAQIAPIVVAFALTPVLLHRLGANRFGVWSLALVILATLTALDGGVAASLARFFAVYDARKQRAEAGRLLTGALSFFGLLALAVGAVAFPLAPHIVPLLHMPSELRGETATVLRWLPLLAGLGLVSDATAALLEGTGKFRALSVTMLVSSAVFLAAVMVLVQPRAHVPILMLATGLRYAAATLTSLIFARRQLSFRRPLLPTRSTARELWRYSSRMQLSAATGFVNSQLDALVIAAIFPVRYVGLYSIGMQAASAARSVPLYAFPPLLTLLSSTFGRRGREAAAAEFDRMERKWVRGVFAYGVIATAAVGFSVPIWLGERYVLAGLTAAILLSGYIVHVGLTGLRTCYVRAIGRPGLETRYSLVWTVSNAAITIPLALVAGMLGVVAATALTGVAAAVYFVLLCRRRERLPVIVPGGRWWAWAAASVGMTVAGELVIRQLHVHGFLPLVLTGVPASIALGVLLAAARQLPAVRLA